VPGVFRQATLPSERKGIMWVLNKKYTFSALQVPLKEERALIDARVSGSQTEVDGVTANCLNYWARAHCHLNKLRKLQLRNTNLFSVLVSGAMPLAS